MSEEFQNQLQEQDFSHTNSNPWKKIFNIVFSQKSIKRNTILMIFFVLLLTLAEMAFPLLNMFAIRIFFEQQKTTSYYLTMFIVAYVLLCIIIGISCFSFIYFGCRVEAYLAYELRKESFANIQKLSFSYFDKTPQGWILARMTTDTQRLSTIISWGIVDLLFSIFTMVVILVVLIILNPLLTLIIFPLIPILFICAILIRKKMLVAFRESKKVNSELTATINEGIMGITTTKTLVIEEKRKEEFEEKTSRFKRVSMKGAIYSALFTPIIFILSYIGVGSALIAGISISSGVIFVSQLYIFIDYILRFFEPAAMFSQVLGNFQQAHAGAERVVALIQTPSEIFDSKEVIEKYGTVFEPKYENFEELVGKIEFKDVCFRYNEGQNILQNFNLKIKEGTSVALVGHSGSGKSTIVNLISRFYEPTSGTILIDDKDYKSRSITWLHSNLGYVLQTPQLFSGSIMENIRYGNLDASDEQVINAAKIVNAHNFINNLNDKYDTSIDEGGAKLSLGEKQLISFARAVIANPKILILDEATSSIDTKSEALIQDAVNKVLKGRTCFVIAHRLSTIINSDLILVMQGGKIVESGNHKELLQQRGYYFQLYKDQFTKEQESKLMS